MLINIKSVEQSIFAIFFLIGLFVLLLGICEASYLSENPGVEFVDIPENGVNIAAFQMAKTEITNHQYVDFLNAALKSGEITVGKVEPLNMASSNPKVPKALMEQMRLYKSKNQQLVYDKNGNRILNLLNIRMTGDHGHNGVIDKWEMKNPLNRSMIEYDEKTRRFTVVDPEKVDWEIYFNTSNLPEGVKPVDTIKNWAELHKFWPKGIKMEGRPLVSFDKGDYNKNILFAGPYDLDFQLPTIEEVKKWPVIYIEYYSAKIFADFYGYDLPTVEEYKWAAAGGKEYEHGTGNGTINPENVIYNGHSIAEHYQKLPKGGLDHSKWPGQSKGHVQPVASLEANPYGLYNLSGNVTEWTKSKNDPEFNCRTKVSPEYQTQITVGGNWTYPEEYASFDKKCFTETNIGATNDHFGFRVVKRYIEKIEFASIPENGEDIQPFQIAKTEITNQQYVNFLNSALKDNIISVGRIEPLSKDQLRFSGHKSRNQRCVYDKNGKRLIDLLGIRVTGDHNHNGEFEFWEMENPLNRIMIEYDDYTNEFRVVNPEKVDWNIYFNKANLPDGIGPADNIMNWAELHKFWPKEKEIDFGKIVTWDYGHYNSDVIFAGHLDLDAKLPSLEEVKNWPANHIEYYGAKAFSDYYGYELPTLKQIQWAGAGGKGYEYATNDGTINENIVYSGHSFDEYPKAGSRPVNGNKSAKPEMPDFTKFPGKDKGHVQAVATFPPNPYGVFDLSGNVYEWTKSTLKNYPNAIDRIGTDTESFIRIGGSWNYYDEAQSLASKEAKNTGAHRGNDHFGFRVVKKE